MKVVQGLPPNYDEIAKAFGFSSLPGTFNPVFAYGDTLYNPSGLPIAPDLMAHEETHEQQQSEIGVELWWQLYLENKSFRLKQEAEAYQNQYRYVLQHYTRSFRRSTLQKLAKDFSSALYGNIISKKLAEEIIENE